MAWTAGSNVLAARFDGVDAWEEPETLDGDLRGELVTYGAIDVAATAGAGAMVVWAQPEDGILHIWASRYQRRSGWTDPELVDAGDTHSTRPRVALAPDGTAVVAWTQYRPDPFAPNGERWEAWARILVP